MTMTVPLPSAATDVVQAPHAGPPCLGEVGLDVVAIEQARKGRLLRGETGHRNAGGCRDKTNGWDNETGKLLHGGPLLHS